MTEDLGKPIKHTKNLKQEDERQESDQQGSQQEKDGKLSSHGRWTREEHDRFIDGLQKYGKNWKKVEQYIGTRTGAQIRSHAQKYFNRVNKEGTGLDDNYEKNFNMEARENFNEEEEEDTEAQEEKNSDLKNCSESGKPSQQNNSPSFQLPQHLNQSPTVASTNAHNHHYAHNSAHISHNSKKKDWSKILSEQQKMREQGDSSHNHRHNQNSNNNNSNNSSCQSKKEKKSAEKEEKKIIGLEQQIQERQQQELQQQEKPPVAESNKIDLLSQIEHSFRSIPSLGFEGLRDSSKSQSESEVSPADFISQQLLSSIFEPVNLQTHLLQFYIAQVSLNQLIEYRRTIITKQSKNFVSSSFKSNGPNTSTENNLNSSLKSSLNSNSPSLSFSSANPNNSVHKSTLKQVQPQLTSIQGTFQKLNTCKAQAPSQGNEEIKVELTKQFLNYFLQQSLQSQQFPIENKSFQEEQQSSQFLKMPKVDLQDNSNCWERRANSQTSPSSSDIENQSNLLAELFQQFGGQQ